MPRLWWLLTLLPLPWLFAWFRWRWTREAYLPVLHATGLGDRGVAIHRCVRAIWQRSHPWPRRWMLRWFEAREGVGAVAQRHRLTGMQMIGLMAWNAHELQRGWRLTRHSRGAVLEKAPWGWSVKTDRGYDRPMEPPTPDVMKAMRHSDLTSAMRRASWLEGVRVEGVVS